MKPTYQETVKQRSRVKLRKFIKRHLPNYQSAKVLCLPGHEAIEIYEVYDKLGIPRENIYCLERDPKIAKVIRSWKLGVNVIEEDFTSFAATTGLCFDVLSLDFMGQLGTFESGVFDLVSRRRVCEPSIVFTNFCGNRENGTTKAFYANEHEKKTIEHASRDKQWPQKTPVTCGTFRGDAIHLSVRNCLRGFKNHGYFSLIDELFFTPFSEEFIKEQITEEQLSILKNKKGVKTVGEHMWRGHQIQKVVESCLLKNGHKEFIAIGIEPVTFPAKLDTVTAIIEQSLLETFGERLEIYEAESFSYTSNSRTPMFGDLFFLKSSRKFNFLSPHLNELGESVEEIIAPLVSLNDEELSAILYRAMLCLSAISREYAVPSRAFLGKESEAIALNEPVSREEQKEKIIEMLRADPATPTVELARAVGVKPGTVAAWRAHFTMGTYAT